jgi:diacylglycerol kinase family enzyme
MVYILYNPKAHKESNDLNIVQKGNEIAGIRKINIVDLDVEAFSKTLNESDRVLIRGGDGTLHHFANNAWGVEFPCKVCMIRSGTGNDFLNDIGQMNSVNLVDIRGYLRDLPAVTVKGKTLRFVNGAGLGVDGSVCHAVEVFKTKNPNKKANYTAIALQEIGYKYKRPKARITVDGVVREYDKVWAVSTMKGRYYGGGMIPAPGQDRFNDDGSLSVMVFHDSSKIKTLTIFPSIFKGEHVKSEKYVTVHTGREITVTFDEPRPLQIDGETVKNVTSYSAVSKVSAPKEELQKA